MPADAPPTRDRSSRIGVVSDVHCGHVWLRQAIEQLGDRVGAVWCAGDIAYEHRFCGETVRLLREHHATAIVGNHDAVLLGPHGARARQRVAADDDDLAWLRRLPHEVDEVVAGRRVRMIHGSPWEPHGAYVGPTDRRWDEIDELGVDVLLLGHTHEPMVERFGATLVVNPGSTTEPRQRDRRRTMAVVDLEELTAQIEVIG